MMRKEIIKYTKIFYIALKNYLIHTSELILRSGFFIIIIYIFINLWEYTYRTGNQTEAVSLTLNQMLWYLVATESIMVSKTKINKTIEEDIRSGNICYALSKPYSYVLLSFCNSFGERIVKFCVNFIVGCVMMLLFHIFIEVSVIKYLATVICFFLALVIDTLLGTFFGLIAFWIENASPIYFTFTRIEMIFGGVLIPLSAFPNIISNFAMLLPFRYIICEPAYLFVKNDMKNFFYVLGVQMAYVMLISILILVVYKMGRRKLNINGG